MSIYRRGFKLYSDGKNYVLTSPFINNENLLISVISSELYLNKITNEEWSSVQLQSRYILLIDSYGCLGLLTLEDTKKEFFLLFVRDATSVGSIGTFEILRISDLYAVNLNCDLNCEDLIPSNANLNNNSSIFIELRKFLSSGYFYYKYTNNLNCKFDITLNAQLRNLKADTETRFLWNSHLHAPFRRLNVNTHNWLLKIICGCVEIRKVIIGSDSYKACLISRLSAERAGTRFNCRGANDYGHCANYVETEQIIFSDNEENCFLQLRGSIPLFWEQSGLQVGNHRVKISRSIESSYPAFERHFKTLLKQFNNNCLILNLLSRKGDESLLTDLYQTLYENSSSIIKDFLKFISFDYHNEMKINKSLINTLWPKILGWINENKLLLTFHTNLDKDENQQKVINQQKSIIRTNCLDCLDRTNSVQLFIGLECLKLQLDYFKELKNNDKYLQKFREVFRQMWIINGDNLSKMYAGTGAIQGKSMTQDLQRSLTRAIQNNFLDNNKQDIIDMLLYGAYPTTASNRSAIRNDLIERSRVMLTHHSFGLPSYILKDMIENYKDYTEQIQCHVAVGTWNINGGLNDYNMKNLNLADWLIDGPFNARRNPVNGYLDPIFKQNLSSYSCEFIDIFVIGFEEIVDLNAQNIVNASDENARLWYKKIFDFLCKNGDYMPITHEPLQLVGVCLFIFVHKRHASFIRDVAVSKLKTGLGGAAGNKGGVAMRFTYYNSSMCFICSHFAAHQGQIKQRNDDFKQIYETTSFPQSRDVKSHDYVLWCGDLNYRIDMPNDYVRKMIKECRWDIILQAEQLTLQKSEGFVFKEFNEAPLNFPPTYKYNLNEDSYDNSEKCRTPAWTDRVLWRRRRITKNEEKDFNFGKCLYYGRSDIRYSDHRPVLALFELEVNKVEPKKLYKNFEKILNEKGPFQGTVIVSVDNGKTKITESLRKAIITIILDFEKFSAYREFKNCLYITYYKFKSAFKCCNKFNNYYYEQYNCILNVKMENDDYKELAGDEFKHMMETHVWLNQHEMNEVQVANLLGDDLFDEESFIQVPKQVHSNLTVTNNLYQLEEIPTSSDLLIDHNNIKKSFSNSNIEIIDNHFNNFSLNQNFLNNNGSISSSLSKPNFSLFDLPNDDFEIIKNTSTNNLKSLPVPTRPPPPIPKLPQQQKKEDLLIDLPSSSISSNHSSNSSLNNNDNNNNNKQLINNFNTALPPPLPKFLPNSTDKLTTVHYTKSNDDFSTHSFNIDPFGSVNETIAQPLIPIAQPRLKQQTQKTVLNKDLFLLGDPGTPPPPPPPLVPSSKQPPLLPPQQQQQNITRPTKLDFNKIENTTDFDLLGNPGTPPTPPPVTIFK